LTEHVIHDWHHVGKALSGSGASGEHVVVPAPCDPDGILLVLVQMQGLACPAVGFAEPEDASALFMQYGLGDQRVDGLAALE
jgi:hypothetical protein